MKRKIFALALTLSLLLGMTMALPAVAEEAATEPIIKNGGFEEVAEDGTGAKNWTGGTLMISGNVPGNLSHSGNGFLYIEAGKSIYSSNFQLEPETDYILTLYSRSSIENAGKLDIRFRAKGNTFDKTIPGEYAPGEHQVLEYFGSANSAPAEGETDERFQWEKQQFSFTTPPQTEGAMFYISETKSDSYLCIDDISITPSGKKPNLLRNGYFTTFVNDGARPSGFASSNTMATAPTYSVDENGDTLVTMTAGGYFGIHGIGLMAGRYKLSLEYRNDHSASSVPNFYMKSTNSTDWVTGYRSLAPKLSDGTLVTTSLYMRDKKYWNTYEVYFTVPEGGVRLQDFRLVTGYSTASQPSYLKNVRIWKDESNVEFKKI